MNIRPASPKTPEHQQIMESLIRFLSGFAPPTTKTKRWNQHSRAYTKAYADGRQKNPGWRRANLMHGPQPLAPNRPNPQPSAKARERGFAWKR